MMTQCSRYGRSIPKRAMAGSRSTVAPCQASLKFREPPAFIGLFFMDDLLDKAAQTNPDDLAAMKLVQLASNTQTIGERDDDARGVQGRDVARVLDAIESLPAASPLSR
jgi:hypothetical protein